MFIDINIIFIGDIFIVNRTLQWFFNDDARDCFMIKFLIVVKRFYFNFPHFQKQNQSTISDIWIQK